MLVSVLALSAIVAVQATPTFVPSTIQGAFVEQFVGGSDRWSESKATKVDKLDEVFAYNGIWSVEEPTVYPGIEGDEGLVMKSKAAHHAISVPFSTPLDPAGKPLVIQYEVKLQKGLECGGAYIKLLTDSSVGIQAEEFSDKTPYTIMFGPDRCGSTSKVHFIFRHANPVTGEIEEKHLVAPPSPKITKTTALYTLIVRPDQSFEIKVNDESVKTGSLLEDFSPAVNPAKEIDDPTDVKPENWVESPKITDPEAVKPAEWDEEAPSLIEDLEAEIPEDWLVDEEATIPDPAADKPEEWSDEDDGQWIAPSISNPLCAGVSGCGAWTRPKVANPLYKGKWFAPMIDNPDYIGVWAPKKIANPAYFEDSTPANFNKIAGVGIELWSMTEDILFDNIYIGDSETDASTFAAETYHIKKPIEDAVEAAEAPVTPPTGSEVEPDYRTAPVEWVQYKLQEFLAIAVVDPVAAFKALPYTGAAAGTVFSLLVGLLGVFFSLLLPTSKPAKPVKSTKAVAPVKKVEVVAVADAPVASKNDDVPASGIKTRAGKAAGLKE